MGDRDNLLQVNRTARDETLFSKLSTDSGVAPQGPALPGRYEDLGWIGSGGFGEVRRARDSLLQRIVAMKILRADRTDDLRARRRFLTEVQITADLQHPAIIAVHDQGELADGRLWFTMKEVRGRTLRDLVLELHAASSPEGFGVTLSGWTFRRLVDAFARIVQAVAYAHGRGVVHRDLKPDNLMIGEFGEVVVMDWGLARRIDEAVLHEEEDERDEARAPGMTRHGEILGTPAYMPPEQARGERAAHGPWSDVYALGAVLYFMLTGRPPYQGSGAEIVAQIRAGSPSPVSEAAGGGPSVPAELVDACERAMRRTIAERCPSAERLAEEVLGWLDGTRRREQALGALAEARALEPRLNELRARAAQADAEARALLGALRPFDPIDQKRPGWEREEAAAELRRQAALCETELIQAAHGALTVDPDLPEAHALLADHYRKSLLEAELLHRTEDAARCEALLRAHDRGRHAAFLRGDGALTLVTEPAGAEVHLDRFVLRDRRLVPVFERILGRTPLHSISLSRGSYLLRLRAPGRAEVRYPVLIERDGHWDGCPPGETEPLPIPLPAAHELGSDDIYVPAGWCWIGGDAEAAEGLDRRRIWIDGFVMRRYPVTNREYIAFLDDLVARGLEREALAACPRSHVGLAESGDKRLTFDRDESGRFWLPDDGAGSASKLDWPVVQVDWHAATAFARWLAERTGQPWRLPNELEREKAARGVDGRFFPWGDHAEPTFACVAASHKGDPSRVSVGDYPLDESPYGVRGLAGNTRDWCINCWKREGPLVEGERLRVDAAAPEDPEFRTIKGGAWGSALAYSRSAGRMAGRPGLSWLVTGLRVVREYLWSWNDSQHATFPERNPRL